MQNKVGVRNLKVSDKDLAVNDKSVCVLHWPPKSFNYSPVYCNVSYDKNNTPLYDIGNDQGYCNVWQAQITRVPTEIASGIWKMLL